jgi:putative DNA primase/helicase
LGQIQGVQENDAGYKARCPVTGHGQGRGDQNPSLSVGMDREGNVLLKCFAGCDNESIVEALGLTMADLFEQRNGKGGGGPLPPPKTLKP